MTAAFPVSYRRRVNMRQTMLLLATLLVAFLARPSTAAATWRATMRRTVIQSTGRRTQSASSSDLTRCDYLFVGDTIPFIHEVSDLSRGIHGLLIRH